jgi:hypothetical protein
VLLTVCVWLAKTHCCWAAAQSRISVGVADADEPLETPAQYSEPRGMADNFQIGNAFLECWQVANISRAKKARRAGKREILGSVRCRSRWKRCRTT